MWVAPSVDGLVCEGLLYTAEDAMINSSMTVREVAVRVPHSKRVFEKLRIDYCCGGNQLLTDACASAGLPLDELFEMLKREEPKAEEMNFPKLSLPELVTHILYTHHMFTKKELARLDVLMKKVIAAHGDNHPELHDLGSDFAQLSMDLHPHMFKEEQILFPYILELAGASVENRLPAFAPFGTVNNPSSGAKKSDGSSLNSVANSQYRHAVASGSRCDAWGVRFKTTRRHRVTVLTVCH